MKISALLLAAVSIVSCRQIPLRLPNDEPNSVAIQSVRFDNHLLIQVEQPTAELYQAVEAFDLDLWGRDPQSALIHVSSEQLQSIKESMPDLKITVVERDIQRLIDDEAKRLNTQSITRRNEWFQEYHRYDEIKQWYSKLAEDYPELVKFVPSIGKSHEGRDIFALHLTSQRSEGSKKKSQIWFQGQIHAREWISGATVQYIANSLVTGYGKDVKITKLLDSVELIVIPCLNPDGYEYTWTTNRLWRKNRRNNGRMSGFGVDLNRNWNEHWDSEGSSRSPQSETYRGPAPASEPEVQALSKYFLKHKRIIGAIDFHSFSQLILRPLGYSNKPAAHEKEHKAIGDEMRDIIKSVHGKDYTSIPSVDLYPTAGSASDWFYGDEVRKEFGHSVYGFTIELRPKSALGPSGFILPPDQIIPTGEEITPAVVRFMEYVVENPLKD